MRLKELREARDLTQSELGKQLNISPSAIGMYEQGRRYPSLDILNRMADFFHVSTDYLLGRDELTLGEYLRMARQHVAYAPEYVAELTGIKADTLISWEKNAAKPSQAELETLAKVYYVSVDILTGKDVHFDSRAVRPILSAEENLAADLFHRFGGVLKALAGMSPAKQELAKDMIALLANEDKKA